MGVLRHDTKMKEILMLKYIYLYVFDKIMFCKTTQYCIKIHGFFSLCCVFTCDLYHCNIKRYMYVPLFQIIQVIQQLDIARVLVISLAMTSYRIPKQMYSLLFFDIKRYKSLLEKDGLVWIEDLSPIFVFLCILCVIIRCVWNK